MKKTNKLITLFIFFLIWSWLFGLLDLTVEMGLCGCPNTGDFPPGLMVDCGCAIFLNRPFYSNLDLWEFVIPVILLLLKIFLSILSLKLFLKIFKKKHRTKSS